MTKQRSRILSPFTLAAAASLALAASPRASRAFDPDSHPCFATAPKWNATNGALVSGISPGVISAIFAALGQSRTHVMMANVTQAGEYWATESTTLRPSVHKTTVKACFLGICADAGQIPQPNMPLEPKELAQGSPGLSQINMGGAYAYWQSATQVFREKIPASSAPDCRNDCKVRRVADYLWNDLPFDVKTSTADPNAWFYSLMATDSAGTTRHLSYGVHQFMAGTSRISDADNSETPAVRGIACSEVPAWGYRNWILSAQPTDIAAGTDQISTHRFTKALTVDAGNALWQSVYDGCMNIDLGTWGGLVNLFSTVMGPSLQQQTCHAAAYQVLNCFFQGENSNGSGCTSIDEGPWTDYEGNNAAGARSMSPDDIMGLSGAAGTGPWASGTQMALQWNGGGSTYGCFY